MKVAVLISLACLSSSYAYAGSDVAYVEKMLMEERYDHAVDEAEKLIDSSSGRRDELYYLKGLSELKLNRFSDARRSFEYILTNYPQSKNVFDANVGIGDSYFLEGNTSGAIRIYGEILEKFPNDRNISVVYRRMSDCYEKTDKNKAKFYIDKAAPRANFTPVNISRSEPKGGLSIQVGCFKSKRNAEGLSKKLSRKGYESYVEMPSGPDNNLFRVKAGRLASKEDLASLATRLKRDGYQTKLCDDGA